MWGGNNDNEGIQTSKSGSGNGHMLRFKLYNYIASKESRRDHEMEHVVGIKTNMVRRHGSEGVQELKIGPYNGKEKAVNLYLRSNKVKCVVSSPFLNLCKE